MKRCIKCDQTQPITEFYFHGKTGVRMNVCRVCHKARATKAQALRRANYMAQGLRLPKERTWGERQEHIRNCEAEAITV